MHRLFTTYLSKLKNLELSNDCIKVVIMRIPPKSLTKKTKDLIFCFDLAPKREILYQYKNDKDWDNFVLNYNKQMNNDNNTIHFIQVLINTLKKTDVCIICCEKDYSHCHRWLLANKIRDMTGCEIKEL